MGEAGRPLGQEDPLEEGMAAHSTILAWRIPWTEEPGGLHSMDGRKDLDVSDVLNSLYICHVVLTTVL